MNKNILDITIAPECPHKDCGQIFNESNLRLAIYLNGIFFLVKPEKGIIGFTCPKCQKTIVKHASFNDTLKAKDTLSNSPVEVVSYSKSEDGKTLIYPKSTSYPSLNYVSPFMLSSEIIGKFRVDYFQSTHQDYSVLSDTIIDHVEKNPELKDKYCSFAGDANNPISTFKAVYWFDENNIGDCLNYEVENHVRIFPRYHYQTVLVEQINSLLGINYFMGKTFEQTKEDHEREHAQTIESLESVAYENNLNFEKLLDENNISKHPPLTHIIEQNQSRVANDPAIPAGFLNVLTSNPYPLGNLLTADICDYLWPEINPFENRVFPEFFVDELDDPGLGLKIHEKKEEHISMAKLVQENSFKQYTQHFLRENLIDFLEEYENLIQGNEFSYAHVWQLKESYLEGVYKTVNKGLREEVPYAMYREGEGWKFIFNGKSFGGLRGKGFLWIYLTIFHKSSPVYYTSLHDRFVTKSSDANEKQVAGSKDERTVPKRKGYTDFEQVSYREKAMDDMKNTGQVSFTYSGVLTKQFYVDVATLKNYQEELDQKELAIEKARQSEDIETFEETLDDMTEFLEDLEKKYGIRKIKNADAKPGERNYKLVSQSFKDERYKKIGDNIKKNYRDALNLLKKTKGAGDLHAHLLKSICKEDGAFIYKPSEDITWHLD